MVSFIPERRKYRIRIGCLVKTKNQKEERKKEKEKKRAYDGAYNWEKMPNLKDISPNFGKNIECDID